MNSRRKFLIQGSLATTAVLALKPFTTFSKAASSFSFLNGDTDKLVFLHTASLHSGNDNRIIQYINDIKNKNRNAILLKAGQVVPDESGKLVYDVSISESKESSAITDDYKIIQKGSVRTGVISAKQGDSDIAQKINSLSAYLKKEKNCKVVVCLSQLGYKNRNTPDDIMLAKQSTHLDIIISGHTENFHKHPVIALNKNHTEVIIHSASGDPAACGLITLELDGRGQKQFIGFTDQASKNSIPKRSMPAA